MNTGERAHHVDCDIKDCGICTCGAEDATRKPVITPDIEAIRKRAEHWPLSIGQASDDIDALLSALEEAQAKLKQAEARSEIDRKEIRDFKVACEILESKFERAEAELSTLRASQRERELRLVEYSYGRGQDGVECAHVGNDTYEKCDQSAILSAFDS